jgi:hypothetical protein
VYPLNMACWDGKVSEHWQKEEHALDTATLPSAASHTPGPAELAGKATPTADKVKG